MALGFVAYDIDNNEIFNGSRFCGKIPSSSNIAEYRALIAALYKSLDKKIDIIHIIGDSQLVIKQVTGAFKANKPELIRHRDVVRELLEQFSQYTIKWVPRRENKRADALVNAVFERRKQKCPKQPKQRKQRRRS